MPEPAQPSEGRLLASAFLTLTLSILGSSVLPVPFAWSRAGVLPGLLIAVAVAAANAAACRWLMHAAAATRHTTYEGLAAELGGRAPALVTRAGLALLLFGTIAGDVALLADVAPVALGRLFPYADVAGRLPSGRLCAATLTVLVVAPLSFLKHMRSLETAAAAGVVVVAALIAAVARSAWAADFPALRDGDLSFWAPNSPSALVEFAGVIGFAFYLVPCLFPVAAELGARGPAVAGRAATAVTLAVAPAVYSLLGVLGAARFGLDTQGSLLVNGWLGGGAADGALDAAAVAYLCLSVPPMTLSLRFTLEAALIGETLGDTARLRAACTLAPLGAALAVALAAPRGAEKIFAATGALPVCVVCYLMPAWVRVAMLRRDAARPGEGGEGGEPLLEAGSPRPPRRLRARDLAAPAAVATLGLATSGAAAVLAARALVAG